MPHKHNASSVRREALRLQEWIIMKNEEVLEELSENLSIAHQNLERIHFHGDFTPEPKAPTLPEDWTSFKG